MRKVNNGFVAYRLTNTSKTMCESRKYNLPSTIFFDGDMNWYSKDIPYRKDNRFNAINTTHMYFFTTNSCDTIEL